MVNSIEIFGIVFFFLGLSGLLTQNNIVKSVLSLSILELGVVIFILSINYRPEQKAPMLSNDPNLLADPLPQAMMITTIVIGVAVLSVTIALVNIVHRKYNTSLWHVLQEEKDEVTECT